MDLSMNFNIGAILLVPICTFIHELGHALFVKLIGGKVIQVEIGAGPVLFQIGSVAFKKMFFAGGYCSFEWPNDKTVSKFEKFLVFFGGVAMNALFIVILYFLRVHFHIKSDIIGHLNFINFFMIILCLVPFKLSIQNNRQIISDGKRIFELFSKNS